jgi:hypothetical protein
MWSGEPNKRSGAFMIKVGSQMREKIEDTDLRVIMSEVDQIIAEDEGGNRELWVLNDDFAGYVLVVNGLGYEFVRSV